MPENPVIPPPNVLCGEKPKKTTIPSPDVLFSGIRNRDDSVFGNLQESQSPDKIIDQIPELPGNSASKKEVLKDYVSKRPKTEDISDAILTMQGKHPKQKGGVKYYLDVESGKPIPLANDEIPPEGQRIASLWGTTEKSAKDDNFVTDILKHTYNIAPNLGEDVIDLVQTVYGGVTGYHSENLQSLKNTANYLKLDTDKDLEGGVFNKTHSFKDLNWDNLDFSPEKIWGTTLQLGQVLGEMAIPAGIAAESVKGAKWASKVGASGAKELTTAGKWATAGTSSALVNQSELSDAADRAGLSPREKAAFVTATLPIVTALDVQGSLGGKVSELIASKAINKEVTGNVLTEAAKKLLVKNADGSISKEALEEAVKEVAGNYPKMVNGLVKEALKTNTKETLTEIGQEVVQKTGQQLFDKIGGKEKFGTDVFSEESIIDYLATGVNTFLGALPASGVTSHMELSHKDKIRIDAEKGKNVYEIVKKGDEAVKAFKHNVEVAKESGELTESQAADAITRVNAYNEYNKDITPLQIPDEGKRELFDLTFQKENLKSKLEVIGDPKELGPIGEGIYNGIQKQAKDLQKKIDEIIVAAQIKDETTVAEKTVEDVIKPDQPKPEKEGQKKPVITPEMQALIDKHKEIAKKEDTRSVEEIPIEEFNKDKFIARDKHRILFKHIKEQPKSVVFGTVIEKPFDHSNAAPNNSTYAVEFGDGRKYRFSSSQILKVSKTEEGQITGGHRSNTFEQRVKPGDKVGMKAVTIEVKGEKPLNAIKIYNATTGKFVAWGKATQKGANEGGKDFTEKQAKGEGGLDDEQIKDEPIEGQEPVIETIPVEPNSPTSPTTEVKPIENIPNEGITEVTQPNPETIEATVQNPITKPTETIESVEQESVVKNIANKDIFSKNQNKTYSNKIENIQNVVDLMKQNLPSVEIIYDENLNAAGQLHGNTIRINPYHAGKDTPIHEVAHILLDAMSDNKVKAAAIEQLKSTDLWKETKERYPELNDKELGNEVLAEAIGREGADIFDTESQRSRFKHLLDYIFTWLKQKLGLDKNIAKSLAKRIIGGIKTKKLTGKSDKVKRQERKRKKSFREFREKVLGRNVSDIRKELSQLKEMLDLDLDAQTRTQIEDVIRGFQSQFADDKEAYEKVESTAKELKNITSEKLNELSLEELTQAWSDVRSLGDFQKEQFKDIKRSIAEKIHQEQNKILKENPAYKESQKRDMTWREKWFKTLSDVSHEFPFIQGLSNVYEEKVQDKYQEIQKRKEKLEGLAKAVIKERNKTLGSVVDWFTSDSAKYFEYLDNNGKIRTDKTGLTKSQIAYMDYMQELINEKNEGLSDDAITNDIIRLDKGFQERFRTEGLMAAVKGYFTMPNEPSHSFNYNGTLTSKFNAPRDKDKGYSKDFYRAGQALIEDLAHVKYMNDVVPIVDAVELFYTELGLKDKDKGYKNTLQFLEEWKNEQLYEKKKITDPKLDFALRSLRQLASATVMGFNLPANIMNAAMGNYNAWRKDGLVQWGIGNARLFGGTKRAGYGTVSQKALDVLKMFDVVQLDVESNPKFNAKNFFTNLAFAGQKWGEYQIQGSQFLGYLEPKEWDKLKYNKDGKLEIEGTKEEQKAFKKKMSEYKQNVANIQGKYSSKDRRNFMRFEYGKSAAQFRLWMPDFIKERFGAEFIDRNGNLQRGSWNRVATLSLKELKKDFTADYKEGGLKKTVWDNKRTMSNLKGAMTVAFLMIAANQDDDDEGVRKQTLSLENGLSNLLFLFDPQQAKYTLTSPPAGVSKVVNFIDAFDGVIHADGKKFKKNAKKLIPGNKLVDIPQQIEDLTK